VQFVGVFLVGMFVFMMGVWVTNGLRSTDRTDAANQAKAAQKTAMIAWQNALEPALSTVGQLNGPVPPTIEPTVTAAAANLAKGRPAGAGAADLLRSAAVLKTAAATVDKVDLVNTIAGRASTCSRPRRCSEPGLDGGGARGLEQAARLSVLAIGAEGATQDRARGQREDPRPVLDDLDPRRLQLVPERAERRGPRRRRPGPGQPRSSPGG
jgi:hypothetical protein